MSILTDIFTDTLPESFLDCLQNDYLFDVYGVFARQEGLDANIIMELDNLVDLSVEERDLKLKEIVIQLNSKIEQIKIEVSSDENDDDDDDEEVYI